LAGTVENRAKVRKIREFSMIAVAALSLTSGCSMLPWKHQEATGGAAGKLSPYSESLESPVAAPTPPMLARQSSEHPLSVAERQIPPVPASQLKLQPPVSTPAPPPSGNLIVMQAPQMPRTPKAPSPPPETAALPVPEPAAEDQVALQGVLFARNSSDIGASDERILDSAVYTLKRHPSLRIYVKGYSDSRGRPTINQKLSQERAATVAAYLLRQGVPLDRLVVLGMGSTHPIANNATAAGRAKNRRVELEPLMYPP